MGRPRRLHIAAKESLLEYQRQHSWAYQDEMAAFIEEEWGINAHKSTICRVLKKEGINRKKGQRVGPQSQQLRNAWQVFMMDVTAD